MLLGGRTAKPPYAILVVEPQNGTNATRLLQDYPVVLQGIGQ